MGLALTIPRPVQGLGNAAIAAVADEEQFARFKGLWVAMAITEPGAGSDSANIGTTATLDGNHYVINGEKIFIAAGARGRRRDELAGQNRPRRRRNRSSSKQILAMAVALLG